MSEDINKLIEKAVENKMAAKEKELAAKEQSKDNYEKLAAKIDEKLNHNHKDVNEHGSPGGDESQHVHATHSGDKTCKTCGEKNPDYDADQATCTNCGEDVGTVKEIEAGDITTCKNCGSHEAEHKSKGYKL